MLTEDIKAFAKLGELMKLIGSSKPWPGFDCGLSEEEYNSFEDVIISSKVHNQWFTIENVKKSFLSLGEMLQIEKLNQWISKYSIEANTNNNTVAIIMAGNIPLVGFHDLLCTVLSGSNALIKLSSDDKVLMPNILKHLFLFEPSFERRINIAYGKLQGFDRVIATGSNNTSRYFDYYFGKYPNIIRKNRSSVAILSGDESKEELENLGLDIFTYFGMGCRNVSKIYIPENYDIDVFFKGIFSFGEVINHNKYANNYDYNKAIWLLNNDQILDNGFILLKECSEITAPTATLYYERYSDLNKLREELSRKADEIQCVVSKKDIPFGQAQCPNLSDYADNVDTLSFLISNKSS